VSRSEAMSCDKFVWRTNKAVNHVLKSPMKRYYIEGEEVGNYDDSKCEKEETDLMYSIFSNIHCLS
jgi:hypothetical protein